MNKEIRQVLEHETKQFTQNSIIQMQMKKVRYIKTGWNLMKLNTQCKAHPI
jgi:hypothetical protein